MALKVVIYGGCGALGRNIVTFFKKNNHVVTSIDLASNDAADHNVLIKNLGSWEDQHKEVSDGLSSVLGEQKVDAIFCVAGGWAGGNAGSKNFVKSCDLMWKQSVWSSVIAGNLASKFLKQDGILTLTGAEPALGGTSGMVGYGMAKAAVHQLCKSLSGSNSGMPKDSCTVCIAPVTLDTPMNRKNMPSADFSTWTPLEYIAETFSVWANGEKRPVSGSVLKVVTSGGTTTTIVV
uniref:Dihydropteridine reductase n=1 Tax=Ciona savignyi TaxID=51511 RepID=H2ZAX6_CIOSA